MVNTLSLFAFVWLLSSKIYMADLESALHYILRVEVGKFSVLEGQRLVALKKFMAVLAQVSRPLASLVRAILGCHVHPCLQQSAPALFRELVVWLDIWPHNCPRPPWAATLQPQPCPL